MCLEVPLTLHKKRGHSPIYLYLLINMGSKASTPVVVKEVLTQACNMRDVNASMASHVQLPMLISLLLIFVMFGGCVLSICLMRRHYHRKIRKYTKRIGRAEDVV